MKISKPAYALFGLVAITAILAIAPSAFAETAEVTIAKGAGASANADCISTNNCFAPNPLTVSPGTQVEWDNGDSVSHTITSGKPSDETSGTLFDSGLVKPGKTFQFTFADAGTYDYFCAVHPWMAGQVIVSASAAASTQSNEMESGSMNMSSDQTNSSGTMETSNTEDKENTMTNTTQNMVVSTPIQDNDIQAASNNTQSTTTENTQLGGIESAQTADNSQHTGVQDNSIPVAASTAPGASQDQISAWVAGFVILGIMSGVGVWTTTRRK